MKSEVRFVVGCDLAEFRRYYRTLDDLHDYYKARDLTDVVYGELGKVEEGIIKRDPRHLIVWKDGKEILGHAIWHESSTDEHRKGVARDKDDKQLLRQLMGGRRDFVELHEIWLGTKHRGRGYGERFFDFFEDWIIKRGYDSIVYCTDNAAGSAICRKRGYTEGYLPRAKWRVFCLRLNSKQSNAE